MWRCVPAPPAGPGPRRGDRDRSGVVGAASTCRGLQPTGQAARRPLPHRVSARARVEAPPLASRPPPGLSESASPPVRSGPAVCGRQRRARCDRPLQFLPHFQGTPGTPRLRPAAERRGSEEQTRAPGERAALPRPGRGARAGAGPGRGQAAAASELAVQGPGGRCSELHGGAGIRAENPHPHRPGPCQAPRGQGRGQLPLGQFPGVTAGGATEGLQGPLPCGARCSLPPAALAFGSGSVRAALSLPPSC